MKFHRIPAIRLLWCAIGAAGGISLALYLVAPPASPFLLASLGGSAAFLFGLTRAPAAQPRALFGGHIGSSLIGVVCYQMFGEAIWVYALALSAAMAYMLLTRTMHPPAGADPLLMISSHSSFLALWQPVAVGIATLAAVAFVWSRLYPGLCRYPAVWFEPSPSTILWGGWKD